MTVPQGHSGKEGHFAKENVVFWAGNWTSGQIDWVPSINVNSGTFRVIEGIQPMVLGNSWVSG
jgi:hypothetical protein